MYGALHGAAAAADGAIGRQPVDGVECLRRVDIDVVMTLFN